MVIWCVSEERSTLYKLLFHVSPNGSSHHYKLCYFDLKGLGESVRYMLAYAGREFDDARIAKTAWKQLKPKMPFGKMPVLEIDGHMFHDSVALCRYLGAECGIAGDTHIENLCIDQIVGALGDLLSEIRMVWKADESTKEKVKDALVDEIIPFYLERLDKLILRNGGFLANHKLSWGDIYFTAFYEILLDFLGEQSQLLSSYKNITGLVERIQTLPGIHEWLQQRPRKASLAN